MKNIVAVKLVCVLCLSIFGALSMLNAGTVGVLDGVDGNSTFEDATTTVALPNASYDWTVTSGVARVFYNAANSGIISAGSQDSLYTVQLDTGVSIEADRIYNLLVDIGFFTTSAAGTGDYKVEIGTLNGGIFTLLDSYISSTEWNSQFDSAPSDVAHLTYLSGATVSGDSVAVRLSRTGGSVNWMGFDNVVLTSVEAEGSHVSTLDGTSFQSTFNTNIFQTPILPDGWSVISGGAVRIYENHIIAPFAGDPYRTSPYTVQFDTGKAMVAKTDYLLTVDTSFIGAPIGAPFTIEIGSLDGVGAFTSLASRSDTMLEAVGTKALAYTTGASVSGDVAVRLSRDSGLSGRWFGYDNVILTARPPSGTIMIVR